MLIQLLWLLLPAMAANMAPVFAARFSLLENLDRPLDRGRTWRGARLLGDHKTIRGFVVGVSAGALIAALQHFVPVPTWNTNTPLQTLPTALAFGAYLGFIALAGDALKSFFKRRLHIRPGKSWPIFDQIDFGVASILAISVFVPVSVSVAIVALVIIGIGSLTTSAVGVLLRIKLSL